MASPANLVTEGLDPKGAKLSEQEAHDLIAPVHPLHNHFPVTFEDYLHYAELQRAREARDGPVVYSDESGHSGGQDEKRDYKEQNENATANANSREQVLSDLEKEHITARRALRVSSWAAVFYLITTDILGPFNAPFAFSQVGYVPGVILYFVMGVAAFYTGLILWKLFVKLDSDRYPIRTYSDLAERIYGKWARHLCTVLQSIQLIVNVGTICLSNGQSLSQITLANLCFSVCIVIWAIIGMVIGQIRTLNAYGWLANLAVWLNLSIIFITMGFVAHSPPNYVAAMASFGISPGPVVTAAFVPQTLFNKVNGIMNMVFAYGGAMIFPEFMAEMRRPMDFWKGMVCAQALIFTAYMTFGIYVYAFQGQFSLGIAYQGVSKYSWQTVNNAIGLASGIIAAGLYGNIGIKVAYINIVEDWFKGPPLISKNGRFIWSGMVVLYWALAFIVGSAIPQVQTISGLIAAVAICQFTYTFPPALLLGYHVILDAIKGDGEHVVGAPSTNRIDSWRNWSRWKRGLFGNVWYWNLFKLFNLVLFLASLSMACLGMWGSGKAIQEIFQVGAATSFGCATPVG